MLPRTELSWRVTRASISAEVSECYCKYKGRSLHALFRIKPKITCLIDSRSLLQGKKSLGQEEREAHKVLSLQIKWVLPFYTKGNGYIWKEHKKIPTFHWRSYMWKGTMYPTKDQEGLCPLALFLRQMFKWYLGLRCVQSFEIWFVPWSCCLLCRVAVGGTMVLMSPLVAACISGMLCNTTWLIVDRQNFPGSFSSPWLPCLFGGQ